MNKHDALAGEVQAIVFDKDGTLFDFDATWSAWARQLLDDLATGDAVRLEAMAQAIGFDLGAGAYRPESPVIAGTPHEVAQLLQPHVPGTTVAGLSDRINQEAADCPLVAAVPLAPLLASLRARGLRLGVATNDAESAARAHLNRAGIDRHFDFVAGSDSGHGGKPAPGQLVAFCKAVGAAPQRCVMVGDSLHDLDAAADAGMIGLGVLTGPAPAEVLAPRAAAVLPDIGHLPAWLDRRSPGAGRKGRKGRGG